MNSHQRRVLHRKYSRRGPPPAGLVQLSTLPSETWVGRTVYHPMCQQEDRPYWRLLDAPELLRVESRVWWHVYRYDVGVVTKWVSKATTPEFGGHLWDDERAVFFLPDNTQTTTWDGLRYPDWNLWTENR